MKKNKKKKHFKAMSFVVKGLIEEALDIIMLGYFLHLHQTPCLYVTVLIFCANISY